MAYSLIWLPEVLRSAGLKVAEQQGWATRGHGEMGTVRGVICHHTVGPRRGNMPSLYGLTVGVTQKSGKFLKGPLAQLGLARDGTYYVIAAGSASHAGAGSWKGYSGNSAFIGIEAENSGVEDDPWPDVQMDAYQRGVAAILRKIGADVGMCCGHKEYAPKRKPHDPLFDLVKFRDRVASIMAGRAIVRPLVPSVDTTGRPTLRRGARGELVTVIQGLLQITQDGVFGPVTEARLRQFQRERDLVPDGIVGPKTWAALQP